LKNVKAPLSLLVLGLFLVSSVASAADCERWGVYEVELKGPTTGNPFVGVDLSAVFTQGARSTNVTGFYDGEGVYRVRFSPPTTGEWAYKTTSNAAELKDKEGTFEVGESSESNHGPVLVSHVAHFAYADGSPYKPVGTTCYAWTSQTEELQEQTLKTLADSPFNKIRMCVFPKWYEWNKVDPPQYAYEGTAPNQWDFSRFNPTFFRSLEQRIKQLGEMGIEVDLILLHPYDNGRWGFDNMPPEACDFYLRYVVARLGAFRNVWWSMANEWDFDKNKTRDDWTRMIGVVHNADPYGKLLGIHNGWELYDHNHPYLTHASIQNGAAAEDAGRAAMYRDVYPKPVLLDEVKYEGDIPLRWGNLSAEEMVHRFWEGTIAGCYVTHGECYLADDDVLWWAKGGVLKGESPKRIAFLKEVLDASPAKGLNQIDKWQDPTIAGQPGEYYLVYLGEQTPDSWEFSLPKHELADGIRFKVEVLDTWNMTVTPVEGDFVTKQHSQYLFKDEAGRSVELPGKPWMALRITRVEEN
jgi:hypothetical protein